MLVYMLLNTVTEMAYIGFTTGRMRHRMKEHLAHTKGKRIVGRFYAALLAWPLDCWEAIVLERSDDIDTLLQAERWWIQACETHLFGVGYNTEVPDEAYAERFKRKNPGPYEAHPNELGWLVMSGQTDALTDAYAAHMGRTHGGTKEPKKKGISGKTKTQMTPEELEFFREAGKRGAAKAAQIDSDFYRRAGATGGAAKHKAKPSSEEMSRRAKIGKTRGSALKSG